jgi:hypothetical protein
MKASAARRRSQTRLPIGFHSPRRPDRAEVIWAPRWWHRNTPHPDAAALAKAPSGEQSATLPPERLASRALVFPAHACVRLPSRR